jgi:Protein of unknown function (DUF2934)
LFSRTRLSWNCHVENLSAMAHADAAHSAALRIVPDDLSHRWWRKPVPPPKFYPSSTMLRDERGANHSPAGKLHMDQSLKNRISERAYEIWAAHGRADGQADQHWLAAEREVLAASAAALARKSAPQKKKSATPRKKRRAPARAKTSNILAAAS